MTGRHVKQSCITLLALLCIRTHAFILNRCERSIHGPYQGEPRPSRWNAVPVTSDDTANPTKPGNHLEVDDSLTLQELSLRFQKVYEHYNRTNELSPASVRHAMLRTRLPQLGLNRCYVAPSTIPNAGQGLFARRRIQKGELITLYPGDALLLWTKRVGDFSGDVGVMFGNHVGESARNATWATSDSARHYEVKLETRESLIADPEVVHDAAYLGHMINDGAALLEDSVQARADYSQRTVRRYNAILEPVEDCHYAVVADKDIGMDQEIFLSYGEGYWLSRVVKQRATDGAKLTVTPRKGASKKKQKMNVNRGGGTGFGRR